MDLVVSSYTPTLTALLESRSATTRNYRGLFGVSQPSTPGLSQLPNATRELTHLETLDPGLKVVHLAGESAKVDSVFEGMAHHSWVHLACHAEQNINDPIESAFRLEDGGLSLSRIMTKSLPNADFAFLSACQTATGADELSDEAVHLAAGMLAAGYRSVIATMWSIQDDDAPVVSAEVYRHLLHGPELDSTRAAYALHYAVQHLRKKRGDSLFSSWVPFIHVGV